MMLLLRNVFTELNKKAVLYSNFVRISARYNSNTVLYLLYNALNTSSVNLIVSLIATVAITRNRQGRLMVIYMLRWSLHGTMMLVAVIRSAV